MMKPSEVSLRTITHWLMIAGSMKRTACGIRIRRHHLALAHADGVRRLGLPVRHRVDAGPEDLGEHAAVVDGEAGDDRTQRAQHLLEREVGDQHHHHDRERTAELTTSVAGQRRYDAVGQLPDREDGLRTRWRA